MAKEFNISQRQIINGRELCPDCVDHPQGRPPEVHDCKNLFYEIGPDGERVIRSQCCCYSEIHGVMDDDSV